MPAGPDRGGPDGAPGSARRALIWPNCPLGTSHGQRRAGKMRRVCIMSVALLLVAPGGRDSGLKRLDTGDASRGWLAVGRLDIDGRGFCTGALIAPDLVLTAAHCLYDKPPANRFDHARIEFLAGWRNGRAGAYRGSAAPWCIPITATPKTSPPTGCATTWRCWNCSIRSATRGAPSRPTAGPAQGTADRRGELRARPFRRALAAGDV